MAVNATTFLVIVAIVIVILLLFVTYIYWGTKYGNDPRVSAYISAIGIVAIVVTVAAFFITSYMTQVEELERSVTTQTTLAQTYWTATEDTFARTPELRRLYKQMYASNAILQLIPDPETTPEVIEQETHMSMKLFQIVEDMDLEVSEFPGGWDDPEFNGWDNAFRSWFQSPLLQAYWEQSKQYFSPRAQAKVAEYIASPQPPPVATARDVWGHTLR
ncbi:Hypothetical protein POVN_LOCUS264 [uncultured virus]|nr:Hypothetical protein POVN_LOCUS264 [uncultured virus]